MIAFRFEEKERQELERTYSEHCCSTNTSWELAFEKLSSTRWFKGQLSRAVNRLARKAKLSADRLPDIKQEALVIFAKSMRRDMSLGFDHQRGSLASLLAVIIYRCCCKSLCQFRNPMVNLPFDREANHPLDHHAETIADQIDVQLCVDRLREPFKQTIQLLLANHSMEEIAMLSSCSLRTVYRRRDRAYQLLREQLENPTKRRKRGD